MSAVCRLLAVAREAFATAWAQPVASVVTIIMMAGMCAAVLLTTGRTVGAEQAVIRSIDSEGTRSIVVRAEPDSGLDTTVLSRLSNVDGIEWVGAFGASTDATNVKFPGGAKVPVRFAWVPQSDELGLPAVPAVTNQTMWASPSALESLGMPDAAGGVVTGAGADFSVGGVLSVPEHLTFLEPLAIVPQTERIFGRVSVLVVVASRPDLVAPVAAAVSSVLAVDDTAKVTLATSESLAALRGMVQGQLGAYGRNLVTVIFSLTAVLVSAILYGLVMLRRKDFGRRRALGASRQLIVALLLTQTCALAVSGAVVGCAAAAVGLAVSRDPLPDITFFAAVAVLASLVGIVAALVPAAAAARRDPLIELRVP